MGRRRRPYRLSGGESPVASLASSSVGARSVPRVRSDAAAPTSSSVENGREMAAAPVEPTGGRRGVVWVRGSCRRRAPRAPPDTELSCGTRPDGDLVK
ncbi:hypothetical protein K933_09437 [Candidatus Halobonum tyrrellensis G22]|uniref:Uncharacterized protein n=1 Tax=Candidatus Halobonum tyrrellensis G22 TaxID=1324957 RepID=V4HCD6_9EURY|nr:hypothetical protein K933_09437 [Candidatus Halobonum tyrrellensis G22]